MDDHLGHPLRYLSAPNGNCPEIAVLVRGGPGVCALSSRRPRSYGAASLLCSVAQKNVTKSAHGRTW
ncbi:hypothetical protein [Nocardia sp. NPDC005366]|uniref:hypothetical protein n=1 Tax=Nocardia sp. NPDC005366 TaxID=3156878 RepID=UPI0033A4D8C9